MMTVIGRRGGETMAGRLGRYLIEDEHSVLNRRTLAYLSTPPAPAAPAGETPGRRPGTAACTAPAPRLIAPAEPGPTAPRSPPAAPPRAAGPAARCRACSHTRCSAGTAPPPAAPPAGPRPGRRRAPPGTA